MGYLIFGGDTVRANIAGVSMAGLAFIGWLAGRARVLKQDEYAEAEDDVAEGDVLVAVVCDTPDGADGMRALLERNGAREIRVEESGESV